MAYKKTFRNGYSINEFIIIQVKKAKDSKPPGGRLVGICRSEQPRLGIICSSKEYANKILGSYSTVFCQKIGMATLHNYQTEFIVIYTGNFMKETLNESNITKFDRVVVEL